MPDKISNWVYIKRFRANSLFWRTFALIFLLLFVPFTALSIIFYTNVKSTTDEEVRVESNSMTASAKNVLDTVINECDLMSSYIANDSDVQLFMFENFSAGDTFDISRFTKSVPLIYKYVDSVYIYSEKNSSVFDGEHKTAIKDLADNKWLSDYSEVGARAGTIIPRLKNSDYPPLITIIKPIYIEDEKRGAVIFNINSFALYKSVISGKYKEGQEIFLINSENKIILSDNDELFGADRGTVDYLSDGIPEGENAMRKVNNTESVVSFAKSGVFKFTYAGVLPMTLYQTKINLLKRQIIIVMILLIFLSFILSYIIAKKSYDPLSEIISFLNEKNPDAAETPADENEIKYIISSIAHHIEDKNRMQETLESRLKALKTSQYAMLQAQINPHFLYNTLETINWMAYDLTNENNPVSEAVINLAKLFRNNLSSSSYLIAIADEIKYTKDYLSILNLRYKDFFDVIWNIDENILSYATIKICLQPLIENAVYHGLKPKDEKGTLKISLEQDEDTIFFTVSDDGIGMPKKDVDSLNEKLASGLSAPSSASHIGLMNVNMRIKIIFGDEYGVRIESVQNKGTSVYVIFPKVNPLSENGNE